MSSIVRYHSQTAKRLHHHLHGGLHLLNPAARHITVFAIIKTWDNFVFQHVVQGLALNGILITMILVFLTVSDTPASFFRIAFAPPSIKNTDINDSVNGGFHTGGSTGFKRSPGNIEPNIRSLQHVTSEIHVIVF